MVQVENPIAMMEVEIQENKASYEHTVKVKTIERIEGLSAKEVDKNILEGLRERKRIFKVNGYHLL